MNEVSVMPPLLLSCTVAYLLVGVGVGLRMGKRGNPPIVSLAAIACWPLLLPLVSATPGERGPFSDRISTCVDDLRRAMRDAGAESTPPIDDFDQLVLDLERADARLCMVDRLLDEQTVANRGSGTAEALRRARARAASEVEAVLDGMVELRLSIGLRALAGNTVPVRERLQDMRSRLAAAREIAALDLESGP